MRLPPRTDVEQGRPGLEHVREVLEVTAADADVHEVRAASFNDYVEVETGLFLGSHPDPEDAFALGADVVVCLASESSSRDVKLNGLLAPGGVHPLLGRDEPLRARGSACPDGTRHGGRRCDRPRAGAPRWIAER